MGIARLLTHLQVYAERVQLGKNNVINDASAEHDRINTVVIDGPGFAYHVYHQALAQRSNARHSLEALPSYIDIAHIAIEWLVNIEQCGLRIGAIFFDGFLPKWKQDTRVGRLQDNIDKLVSFKAQHHSNAPKLQSHTAAMPEQSRKKPPKRLLALPALPFLVPVVIEALIKSKYKDVTSVVHGEADSFCARYARENDAIVLTNDSDLLLYELGSGSAIILFRDIEVDDRVLKAEQYNPAKIASRLGLKSLLPFGFAVSRNCAIGFKECLQVAKQEAELSPDYNNFIKEYTDSSISPSTVQGKVTPQVLEILRFIDPRISEYVLQVPTSLCGKTSNAKSQLSSTPLSIYLPFLIDDPSRASAWSCGQSHRRLGYSMLMLIRPCVSQVEEFNRRGTRIAGVDLPLFSEPEIQAGCETFLETLQRLGAAYKDEICIDVWRLFGSYMVYQSIVEEGKPPPTRKVIEWLLSGQDPGLNWTSIHLTAQLHAALYSIRMLKQLVDVVTAVLSEVPEQQTTIISTIQNLQGFLCNLPPLCELIPPYSSKDTKKSRTNEIRKLYEVLGVGGEECFQIVKAEERRRKRKRKANNKSLKKDKTSLGNPLANIYNILSDD